VMHLYRLIYRHWGKSFYFHFTLLSLKLNKGMLV